MLDSVRDIAYSMWVPTFTTFTYETIYYFRKEKVKETVVTYTSKSDVDKILIEATANENWNISNSKLQILADASHH